MEIIVNVKAGKGNGKKRLDKVTAYLDERGLPYAVHRTKSKGHAEQLARELSSDGDGKKIIVACGGDGTFHEVLNGIDTEKARLGFIPAGRGNDFARGTQFTSLDPIKAVAGIIEGTPKRIDYIQISNRRCLNIAGTGMDVDVLLRTSQSRNHLSYIASLIKCLVKFEPYRVTIHVEGKEITTDALMVGVCNGSQFGSGIKVAPMAKADDGKLDLMIVTKPVGTPIMLVMPTFVKGKHVGKESAQCIPCESAKIETDAPLELDGEIYYDLDFNAHIVKNGINSFEPIK